MSFARAATDGRDPRRNFARARTPKPPDSSYILAPATLLSPTHAPQHHTRTLAAASRLSAAQRICAAVARSPHHAAVDPGLRCSSTTPKHSRSFTRRFADPAWDSAAGAGRLQQLPLRAPSRLAAESRRRRLLASPRPNSNLGEHSPVVRYPVRHVN